MRLPRRDIEASWHALKRSPDMFVRRVFKYPLVLGASERVAQMPQLEVVDLLSRTSFHVRLAPRASRHDWSLGAGEQLLLQIVMADREVRTAFEIGTFNGATTAVIAEALPDGGEVVTVDLPDPEFSTTQSPAGFVASDVGVIHRHSPAAGKVRQLRQDSLTLDAAQWKSWADLVLVDGAHDYEHGYADTLSALTIAKPGGLILWDDFDPYWHGLVHGILDAAADRPVMKIRGLPLAVLVN